MNMKIAIPTQNQRLTAHFGHCENFAIVDVKDQTISSVEFIDPPVHQPGVYPKFLAELGVDMIIAGGMGQKAQNLFSQNEIEYIIGIEGGSPRELVQDYLENGLKSGDNLCDH